MHFRHFINEIRFLARKFFNLALTFVNLQVLAPYTGFEFVHWPIYQTYGYIFEENFIII